MQNFVVEFDSGVEKDLRSVPHDVAVRILARISALTENPFPVGVKKLQGLEDTYRIRIGDYRVVYLVSTKNRIVKIQYVSHRKDAYD
jgi:mRNA interferase RelE/StbE